MKRTSILVVLLLFLAACSTPTAPTLPQPDAETSTVAASRVAAVSGDVVTVTAQLLDAEGDAVRRAGVPVAFYSTGGTLGSGAPATAAVQTGPLVVRTNADGAAGANLTSGPGTVTVTAYLGDDSSGEKVGEVVITFTSSEDPDEDPDEEEPAVPSVSNSTLSAGSDKATTGASVTLTVQLRDDAGDVLVQAGHQVTFASTQGSLSADGATFGEVGEALSLTTAADGTAVAHLRGEVDGAVAVAAYLGDDLDDPQIGTATVTFASVVLEDLVVTYDGEPHALTATFSDPAAAEGAVYSYRTVTSSDALAAAPRAAGVYEVSVTAGGGFPGTATATLTIEPRLVAFADVAFADKVYDGTAHTAATVTLDPTSLVDGDDVALDAITAGFEVLDGDEWVPATTVGAYGGDIASRVVAELALAGADAANYSLPAPPVGAASITPLAVAVAGAGAADKQYDGTQDVEFGGSLEPAPVPGDDVALTAVFATADAGAAVPVAFGLVGADAANYALQDPEVTAAITPRPVTVTASDREKVYGQTLTLGTTAFVATGLLDGHALAGVTLASDGAAAEADAGQYPVVASGAVAAEGTTLGNYAVTYVPGDLSVAPASATVTPEADQGKTYGDSDLVLTYTVAGLVNGDTLSGALGREAGEDVGEYAFTLGDLAVADGNEGGNYVLQLAGEETFAVTARQLVVTPDPAQTKTYGDADPELTYQVTAGDLTGDDVIVGSLGREQGRAVGTYAYTLGDLAVADGNGGANYALSLGGTETFSVTARDVTLGGSFTVVTRAYDGTNAADVEADDLLIVNVVEGDDVAVAPAVEFDDALVGSGKAVTLTAATTLVGADAGNYVLDMTGAPASTGEIVRAPVVFDVSNKDILSYTGQALAPVVVTDVDPVPGDEPVAYSLTYRRIATPSGAELEEGVASVKDAGLYRVTITSIDPRYVGQNDVLVPVSTRPVVVSPSVSGKVYGEADPDLSPVLVGGTLATGHSLSGQLAYLGDDAGSYDLTLGTVAVGAGGNDVTANYALSVSGGFTIEPAPVSFDIGNADITRDGVHVYYGDGSLLIGLEVLSTPAGMNDYVLTYRRTHDENHEPVPARQQTVSAISALGTYAVTIASLNPNYEGTSVRTVWVTDGIRLEAPALGEGGESLPVDAVVGQPVTVTVPFLGADGEPSALGPVPVTFDLTSAPLAGLQFLDPLTSEPITSVTAEPGATSITFQVLTTALQETPFQVSVGLDGWSDGPETLLEFDVQPQAALVVLGDGFELGQDALSAPLTVQLQDAIGLPVITPFDVTLDLVSEGVTFFDASGNAVVTSVTIPAGSSSVQYRVVSDTVGTHDYAVENADDLPSVADSFTGSVTINPKPSVGSLDVTSAQIGDTLTIVVSGSDFAPGATVSFGGAGLSVVSFTVDSDGQITLVLSVGMGAAEGSYDLTITNPDGGTVTVDGAVTVAKPELVAADDGPYGLVEGGSTQIAIADLLANDSYSSSTLTWGFDGIVSTHEVTVSSNGTTLTVNSAGLREDGASFVYRVVDQLGTEATATVTFNVTLPPVEAIVFDDQAEFDAFVGSSYEPPTFQEVFDSWPRASNNTYFADPNTASGAAAAWVYDEGLGSIVQPQNTSTHEMVLSPLGDALEYFKFEATLTSTNTDDDSVGLVIAFVRVDGVNKALIAHRTHGGNAPNSGWGISYFDGSTMRSLTNVSVGGVSRNPGSGWSGSESRVRVERNGDRIRSWATPWGSLADFQGLMDIDLDANTINGTAVAYDLSVFKGEAQYGYYTYSQADSTYKNVVLEGGVARDLAILLTGGLDDDSDGSDDTWTGSEVWRFADGHWAKESAWTIQDELGFPRVVTSVAPFPAPDGEPVGTRYEVRENEVVLLPPL